MTIKLPEAVVMTVIQIGDDERGKPGVWLSGTREQLQALGATYGDAVMVRLVTPAERQRPAPPAPTSIPSAGVPRQDDGARR